VSLTLPSIVRIADANYIMVVTLLSILANHAIAIPLCPSFPDLELRYVLNHSQSLLLLASDRYQEKASGVLKEGLDREPIYRKVDKRTESSGAAEPVALESSPEDGGGMMLYTSGTTSRPVYCKWQWALLFKANTAQKGVLLPQKVLTAQCQSLLKAWNYSSSDYLLHVLPLHHIHGTVNAILAPLFAGSAIEFMFPFNTQNLWERLAKPITPEGQGRMEKITFFTAVPTMYSRLISAHPLLSPALQEASTLAMSPANLRLNISGSAALPTPIKSAWTKLSAGNVLLERYGMTEVGMALSCGLDFQDRVDGSVGWPLPSVQIRLVDTDTKEVIPIGQELDAAGKERHGEIQLRGPTIFEEYWGSPELTAKEFVEDSDGRGNWFKTGDVAIRRNIGGAGGGKQCWTKGPLYFIQGRMSADIIKSGGEKISALEVEREMLTL
jgi:malonyl-CoA/methylmalonyl-CoA synthetase